MKMLSEETLARLRELGWEVMEVNPHKIGVTAFLPDGTAVRPIEKVMPTEILVKSSEIEDAFRILDLSSENKEVF